MLDGDDLAQDDIINGYCAGGNDTYLASPGADTVSDPGGNDTVSYYNSEVSIDGGTGTDIQRRGGAMSGETWCADANLTHPDIVREVHEETGLVASVGADFGPHPAKTIGIRANRRLMAFCLSSGRAAAWQRRPVPPGRR